MGLNEVRSRAHDAFQLLDKPRNLDVVLYCSEFLVAGYEHSLMQFRSYCGRCPHGKDKN